MRFFYADDYRLCVLKDEQGVDITDVVKDLPHLHREDLMTALIADFGSYRDKIASHVEKTSGKPIEDLRVRAPLPRPRNMVCMARNYMESGTLSEPDAINAFHKAPNSVIGPGDTMILPDAPATNFECEAEVAIVIGKRAVDVPEDEAMDYIFGYVPFLDGSARGIPPDRNVFFQGKSRETFAPLGPWIVTADEVSDPYNIPIKCWVNGDLKQDFNTSDMGHNIAKCISWASSIHALEPGDIIATGTNHRGLSSIQDGDTIVLEVGGIGRLEIKVRDELKRTWPRDTRLQRQEKGLPPLPKQLTGKYAPASAS